MKTILFITIIALSSLTIYSQNYNDALLLSQPGIYTGARSLAMGNSYTALSNDISGIHFNPAGIGLVNKVEISGGLNFNSFQNNTSFLGNSTNSSRSKVSLNQFGLLYPLPVVQGSWVFGFGYNRVKNFNGTMEFNGFNPANNSMIQFLTGDFNEQIPITNDLGLAYEIRDPQTQEYIRDTTLINGQLNQSGKIISEGGLDKWSFASSVEVAKGFFVGATFNILSGSYRCESDYYEDDTRNIYGSSLELIPGDETTRGFQTFYLNDVINWDLSGWDAQVGLIYNWIDKFRFGASVKFPSYYTIKEDYLVNAKSYFAAYVYSLNPAVDDPIKYKIKTPFEYSFGASATVSNITIAGDIKLTDYTDMKFTEGFDFTYRAERQAEINELFTTTIDYHLGAEVKIPTLPVFGRAGFMYLQSPFKNDPSQFDKKYLTIGAGTLINNIFTVDIAYAYGWWENFGDNYGVDVSRTNQDITSSNLILNLSINL